MKYHNVYSSNVYQCLIHSLIDIVGALAYDDDSIQCLLYGLDDIISDIDNDVRNPLWHVYFDLLIHILSLSNNDLISNLTNSLYMFHHTIPTTPPTP